MGGEFSRGCVLQSIEDWLPLTWSELLELHERYLHILQAQKQNLLQKLQGGVVGKMTKNGMGNSVDSSNPGLFVNRKIMRELYNKKLNSEVVEMEFTNMFHKLDTEHRNKIPATLYFGGIALLLDAKIEVKIQFILSLLSFSGHDVANECEVILAFAASSKGLSRMKGNPVPPIKAVAKVVADVFQHAMEMRIHPDRPNDAIADGLPALKAYCTQLTFEEIIAYTRVHKSVVYYMYDLCSAQSIRIDKLIDQQYDLYVQLAAIDRKIQLIEYKNPDFLKLLPKALTDCQVFEKNWIMRKKKLQKSKKADNTMSFEDFTLEYRNQLLELLTVGAHIRKKNWIMLKKQPSTKSLDQTSEYYLAALIEKATNLEHTLFPMEEKRIVDAVIPKNQLGYNLISDVLQWFHRYRTQSKMGMKSQHKRNYWKRKLEYYSEHVKQLKNKWYATMAKIKSNQLRFKHQGERTCSLSPSVNTMHVVWNVKDQNNVPKGGTTAGTNFAGGIEINLQHWSEANQMSKDESLLFKNGTKVVITVEFLTSTLNFDQLEKLASSVDGVLNHEHLILSSFCFYDKAQAIPVRSDSALGLHIRFSSSVDALGEIRKHISGFSFPSFVVECSLRIDWMETLQQLLLKCQALEATLDDIENRSKNQKDLIRWIFERFDADADGFMNVSEMNMFQQQIGQPMITKEEFTSLIQKHDLECNPYENAITLTGLEQCYEKCGGLDKDLHCLGYGALDAALSKLKGEIIFRFSADQWRTLCIACMEVPLFPRRIGAYFATLVKSMELDTEIESLSQALKGLNVPVPDVITTTGGFTRLYKWMADAESSMMDSLNDEIRQAYPAKNSARQQQEYIQQVASMYKEFQNCINELKSITVSTETVKLEARFRGFIYDRQRAS